MRFALIRWDPAGSQQLVALLTNQTAPDSFGFDMVPQVSIPLIWCIHATLSPKLLRPHDQPPNHARVDRADQPIGLG